MAEEIIFKTSVDTGSTVKDLQAVDNELNNISESTEQMGSDMEQRFQALNDKVAKGGLSVREYSKTVREYQSIALEAGRTSPIGVQALAQAAQLQDEIGDLRAEVSNLANDGRQLQGALQLGSVVTAGYGAAQGAMALMGTESEDLQKTMVKLTAITSVLNGVEQIRAGLEKESLATIFLKNTYTKTATVVQTAYTAAVGGTTGAMKVLRLAMMAVPLLAIIGGIVALIANFDKLSAMIGATSAAQLKMNEITNEAIDSIGDELSAMDKLKNTLNDETISREQKIKAVEKLQEQYPSLLSNVNAEKDGIQAVNKALELNGKLLMLKAKQEAIAAQRADAYKEQIKDQVSAQTGANKGFLDYAAALQTGMDSQDIANAKTFKNIQAKNKEISVLDKLDKQIEKEIATITKQGAVIEEVEKKEVKQTKTAQTSASERQKAREDEARKQLELQKTIEDLAIANMTEGEEKRRAELALQQQRQRQDFIAKYGEDTKLLKELEVQQKNEVNDLELQLIAESQALLDEATKKEQEQATKIREQEAISKRAELEGKLIQYRDDFEKEQAVKAELALMDRDQQLANENLTEGEKFKIQQEYAQKVSDLDTQRLEKEKQVNDAMIASRQALGSAIADVFGKISGLSKEGSKAAKTFALAEIATNTAIGFMQGLRLAQRAAIQSPTPILTYALFAAQQFAAVATAASNAKKILGASGSVQAPTTASAGGGGTQSNNSNTTTSTPTESNLTSNLQNNTQRVYVVDSDISAVQKQTQKVNAVSTIG